MSSKQHLQILTKWLHGEYLSEEELQLLEQFLKQEEDVLPDAVEDVIDQELLHRIAQQNDYEPLAADKARQIFDSIYQQPHAKPSWLVWLHTFYDSFKKGLWIPVVSAVALLLVYMPTMQQEQLQKSGIQQGYTTIQAQLFFSVAQWSNKQLIVEDRGIPGHTYDQQQEVIIRYRLNQPAFVCLIHQDNQGKASVLTSHMEHVLAAGEYVLGDKEAVQTISLTQQPGKHNFILYASQRPFLCQMFKSQPSAIMSDKFTIEVK